MSEAKQLPRKQKRPDMVLYTPKARLSADPKTSVAGACMDEQSGEKKTEAMSRPKPGNSAREGSSRCGRDDPGREPVTTSARRGKSFQRSRPDSSARETPAVSRENGARNGSHTPDPASRDEMNPASKTEYHVKIVQRSRSGRNPRDGPASTSQDRHTNDSQRSKVKNRDGQSATNSVSRNRSSRSRGAPEQPAPPLDGGGEDPSPRQSSGAAGHSCAGDSEWDGRSITVTSSGERTEQRAAAGRQRRPDLALYAPERGGQRRTSETAATDGVSVEPASRQPQRAKQRHVSWETGEDEAESHRRRPEMGDSREDRNSDVPHKPAGASLPPSPPPTDRGARHDAQDLPGRRDSDAALGGQGPDGVDSAASKRSTMKKVTTTPNSNSAYSKRNDASRPSLGGDENKRSESSTSEKAAPARAPDAGLLVLPLPPPPEPCHQYPVPGMPYPSPSGPFPSPPERELAAMHLTASPLLNGSPLRGAGRGDPSDPGGGLLYVPGTPFRAGAVPAAPLARQLFDPNNPTKPVQVAASSDPSRHRDAWSSSAQPFTAAGYASSPYPTEESVLWNDRSSPVEYSNASRVSQLLWRAAGDIEHIIGAGRLVLDWPTVTRIREHMQQECRQLMVSDLRTWMSLSVDQALWRTLYYSSIEWLRAGDRDERRPLLNVLIDEGVVYFSELLRSLQARYRLPVEQLGSLTFDPSQLAGVSYLSTVAALSQRLLLCLGDLARYKYHIGRAANFSEANRYYLQAQRMNPKNGRPFNQLAILALYAHRRLDCVYFYARALTSSNPFVTAKESLLSLFHESSKKHTARSRPAPQPPSPSVERRGQRQQALRTETWVHPRGGERVLRTLRPESDDEEGEDPTLAEMADADLMKTFTTSYLHVQGKLYTRIGMEEFPADACEMLRLFSHLLSRRPTPLKTVDMLHILAINMFNIANTKLRDERVGSDLRSTYQELALSVAIEMAGHVIQRVNQLLTEQATEAAVADRLFADSSLQTCMVFIKVWSDWLLCSASIWNPPPCTSDYRVRRVADCWASLARLTNLLRPLDVPGIRLHSAAQPGLTVVRLPEDLYLQSYSPLVCADYRVVYVDETLCELELSRDILRLRRITFVTEEYLCGLEPAVLRLVVAADASATYVSQVSSHAAPEDVPEPPASPASEPDVVVEQQEPVPPSPEETFPDGERPDLRRLRRQKHALEQRAKQQEEHSRRLQELVTASAGVAIEVRPRYLVADTNCYVDYLDQLIKLASDHAAYTLTVPVTVLAELDGLTRPGARRCRPGQSAQHVEQVRRTAGAALAFVRGRGQPRVRCVTTRGHVLNSAVFTAEQEDDEEQVTNDDKILTCCYNLERGTSQVNAEGVLQVSREVVLLTEDRNLRLKALSLDVPTRTVPDFLAWAS